MKAWLPHIAFFRDAILNSYSQVFFARSKAYALLLLAVSMIDPLAGLSGLVAVLVTTIAALGLGMDREVIRSGAYGFNSLLVGLGLGITYEFGLTLLVVLAVASLITLLITLALAGLLGRLGLPFLSLPFVLGIWSLLLAARNFEALGLSERGVYLLNELYATGDYWLVETYNTLNILPWPVAVKIYLKSLGAIFFQYNLLSGILITLGLLLYSRIAWLLSVLGFLTAYAFYLFLGADITELSYNYIGFNFLLTAIALGGFFLVPSRSSFLWVLLLVPVLVIFTASLYQLFGPLQLGVYALPFNLVVLVFLYVLKLRTRPWGLQEVALQQYSPEKHLYGQLSVRKRFPNYREVAIGLPVMGEWVINQGPEGEITHKGAWKDAWDFVIEDPKGAEHRGNGGQLKDYYCYGKPVVAPADGVVEEIVDTIPDNALGESNLEQNWGNSLVMRHGYQLYSQISHLKPGSFKVKKGDYVQKGRMLAACGNSGRSPEPHLHFQIQTTSYVGAKTLQYPLSSYVTHKNGGGEFHYFDYPQKLDKVATLQPEDQLKYAFYFVPGKQMKFITDRGEEVTWEVKTDMYNNAYLECLSTGAKAYFHNGGLLHYFTGFEGDRRSLLFHFYLSAYKVLTAFRPNLELTDHFPLHTVNRTVQRYLHDFIAPFFSLMSATFQLKYVGSDDELKPSEIVLESHVTGVTINGIHAPLHYKMRIRDHCLSEWEVESKTFNLKVQCID